MEEKSSWRGREKNNSYEDNRPNFFFYYIRLKGQHEVEQGDGCILGTLGSTPCSALLMFVLKRELDQVGGVSFL